MPHDGKLHCTWLRNAVADAYTITRAGPSRLLVTAPLQRPNNCVGPSRHHDAPFGLRIRRIDHRSLEA